MICEILIQSSSTTDSRSVGVIILENEVQKLWTSYL